ncbi:MAG: hypothetical protein IPO21_06740 [Bacteroidales bacterium]|nr:hypothetical protein [Bacteroidales bacterium]
MNKTKKLTFVFILFLSVQFSYCQDLTSNIEKIKGLLKEVETGKDLNVQKIDYPRENTIVFTRNVKKSNEKSSTVEYTFTLSDIDIASLQEYTDRDLIYIDLTVKGLEKFIKVKEDNKPNPYVSSIRIFAKNIENARLLKDNFIAAIKLAEQIKSTKKLPTTYTACMEWLGTWIKPSNENSKTCKQQFSYELTNPGHATLNRTVIGNKNNTQFIYDFNFADINPQSVIVEIVGTTLSVKANTISDEPYVKVNKDATFQYFENEIKVYCDELETAREMTTIFKTIIPLSKEKVEAAFPTVTNISQIIPLLNKLVSRVDEADKKYEQVFSGDCLNKLTKTAILKDGVKTQEVWSFNFSDIDDKLLEMQISGSSLFIYLPTVNNTKFIKLETNGLFDSYNESVNLQCNNIDDARVVKYLLNRGIQYCKEHPVDLCPKGTVEEKIDWLMSQINNAKFISTSLVQKLERFPSSKMFKFTSKELTSNGSKESVYEFDWSDIDYAGTTFEITNNYLGIKMQTTELRKIINCSKDGNIKNYVFELSIQFNDIEVSKAAHKVIKEIITSKTKPVNTPK